MAAYRKVRIVCIDDHQIVLEGLTQVLGLESAFEVIGTAKTSAEALRVCEEQQPDVILMDLRLRDESGHLLTKRLLRTLPHCKVLVLSSLEGDADIQRALASGARGYVMKGCSREELVRAIFTVNEGKPYLQSEAAAALADHFSSEALTLREMDVLAQMVHGLRNREIGLRLNISEDTVKMHVKNVLAKLGAADRTEAVTVALRRGLAHL